MRRPAARPVQKLGERPVRLEIDRQDAAAVVLLRTIVAPAPSPNNTAVVRSLQSMMLVSFSAAITNTCSACSAAIMPSAVPSAKTNPEQAAPTSNAAAFLAPRIAWRSQACDGSSRSGDAVA